MDKDRERNFRSNIIGFSASNGKELILSTAFFTSVSTSLISASCVISTVTAPLFSLETDVIRSIF